jgi:hypothetical protein
MASSQRDRRLDQRAGSSEALFHRAAERIFDLEVDQRLFRYADRVLPRRKPS